MPRVSDAVALDDVHRILAELDVVPDPFDLPASALTAIGDGVNDVIVVDPPRPGAERFVLKVGTFSTAANLRGGVAAARALRAYTALPVADVLGFDPGGDDRPPAVAIAYCDGSPLARDFDDVENLTDPARVSLMGEVVAAFDDLPADAATGYGNVRSVATADGRPRLVARHDGFDDWLTAYTRKHLESPVSHPAIERVAPRALAYLDANAHRIPAQPSPSVVVTDLSPENLLASSGRPPASVDALAGVVDLERAKLGPATFTAVTLETTLARDVDDPTPVQDALYDPLPFDPDFPFRDLYRLAALSRPVSALAVWKDPESDAFDRIARRVARDIHAIVD